VAGRIVHYYKKNEQVRPWEGIRKVSFVYAWRLSAVYAALCTLRRKSKGGQLGLHAETYEYIEFSQNAWKSLELKAYLGRLGK
jgi:hypothetical protein